MNVVRGIALVMIWVVAARCSPRLPRGFEEAPLPEQVRMYRQTYEQSGGTPSAWARDVLEAQGRAAADALASQLSAAGDRDFDREALIIILKIQSKGVDLRGTRTQQTLRTMLATGVADAINRGLARSAVRAIDAGYHASRP